MATDIWRPGSFTKNFSWGKNQGLKVLYENIRIGFDSKLEDTPRDEYRRRTESAGRPDFIPINFFLFNRIRNGINYLIVDELVFQAVNTDYSPRFDQLALFAFNFSYVGIWTGASPEQRYPALWAKNYIVDRVARDFRWDTSKISARDIEKYLRDHPNFVAQTYTKVATNLSYLYKIGNLANFKTTRIERWWVDALFLALDRLTSDLDIDRITTSNEALPSVLIKSKFRELTGPITPEKTFAMAHLFSLYTICDGIKRFQPENVRERTAILLPDYDWHEPNDDEAPGAMHPTNPRIIKLIPRSCAALAERAGFEIIYALALETFDPEEFIEQRFVNAIQSLDRDNIKPTISAEELHKLTRGE